MKNFNFSADYNKNNFIPYFRFLGKEIVEKKDGSFEVMTIREYVKLERDGKVKDNVFLE